MKRLFFYALYIIILFLSSSSTSLLAFNAETIHIKINENAGDQSILNNNSTYLKTELGLSSGLDTKIIGQKISLWLEKGGKDEDWGFPVYRMLAHFFDPLDPWDIAGLKGKEAAAIIWAQNESNSRSWTAARNYFYEAFTADSQYGQEGALAITFESLGQVMHLVSDMAVPAHVRDDMHLEVTYPETFVTHFEIWTKNKYETLNYSGVNYKPDPILFKKAIYDGYAKSPISSLFDIDVFTGSNIEVTRGTEDIGLAEYTNANFFSEDTVFENYSYPNESEIDWGAEDYRPESVWAEDHKLDNVRYLRRKNPLNANDTYIAAISYFFTNTYRTTPVSVTELVLDDKVYESYAEQLVPRAVGYSSAVLDYFFRGKIAIRNVHFIKNNTGRITGLSFEMKNESKLGNDTELLKEGTIELACQYVGPYLDPYNVTYEKLFVTVQNIYPTTDETDLLNENDPINTGYVPVQINLSQSIPIDAKEPKFTLLFKGTLGDEEDAVVAKVFPLTTKIAYSRRNSPSNIYTMLPDGSDEIKITDAETNPWPQYANPMWSSDGRYVAFNMITCSQVEQDGTCLSENYNNEICFIDQTIQADFPDNIAKIFTFSDPTLPDDWNGDLSFRHFSFSPNANEMVAEACLEGMCALQSLVVYDIVSEEYEYLINRQYWKLHNFYNRPVWSPTGNDIAFSSHLVEDPADWQDPHTQDIFIINRHGTEAQNITDDGYINLNPSWSPDGERLLFVSNRPNYNETEAIEHYRMWIMDKDGSNMEMIADYGGSCFSPHFTYDGSRIVFEGQNDYIYSINPDGSDPLQLTTTPTSDFFLSTPISSPLMIEATESSE